MEINRTAFIVGANGIIGRNMAKYLQDNNNWNKFIITSNRKPDFETNDIFVQMDLTNSSAVENNPHSC